jgi:hypothetical protein
MYNDPPTKEVIDYFKEATNDFDRVWFTVALSQFLIDILPQKLKIHIPPCTFLGHMHFNPSKQSEFQRSFQDTFLSEGFKRYDRTQNYVLLLAFPDGQYTLNSVIFINSLDQNPLFEYFCPHPQVYEQNQDVRSTVCLLIQKIAEEWMNLSRKLCKNMCKSYHFDGLKFKPSNLYIIYFLHERQRSASFKQIFSIFNRINVDGDTFETQAVRQIQSYGRDLAKCFIDIDPEVKENMKDYLFESEKEAQFKKIGQRFFSAQSFEPVSIDVMNTYWPYIERCQVQKVATQMASIQNQDWTQDLSENEIEQWVNFIPAPGAVKPNFFPPPVTGVQTPRKEQPRKEQPRKKQLQYSPRQFWEQRRKEQLQYSPRQYWEQRRKEQLQYSPRQYWEQPRKEQRRKEQLQYWEQPRKEPRKPRKKQESLFGDYI